MVVGAWVAGVVSGALVLDDDEPYAEDDVVLEAPPEVATAMTATAATTRAAPPAMSRERFTVIPSDSRMSRRDLRRDVVKRSRE
jgi:hypothetical protein